MKKYIFTFLAIISITTCVYANKTPLSESLTIQPLTTKAELILPTLDRKIIVEASKSAVNKKSNTPFIRPLQISQTNIIRQSIKTIGEWQSINGESIWRLKISAKDALHLNIGFSNIHLPDSARLFIINAKNGKVLEQYSAKSNKFHGELWTPLFSTNELIIEINISNADKDNLNFEILQAGQGFKEVKPSEYTTKSGSCNIDIVCPQGDDWRNEIRAVARYMISNETGSFLCTGTLINNTRGDKAPLFLTAAHCFISDTTAPSMVFYWNYETSVCAGNPDGSLEQSQNGASLISRWEGLASNSDFALVMLDEVPSSDFSVYYAGWDKRNQSYTGVVAIHQPNGDEKRISIDNDPLTITNFGEEVENLDGHFLKVDAWDDGTTESGSSGSGLWNSNHHLIGTLSGGAASCLEITGSDWYGRIAGHWLGNGFKSNQLAPHLAPNFTNITSLDGTDSCDNPVVTISASNSTPIIGEQADFTSTVTSGSASYTYEWDFNNDGTIDSSEENPSYTYTAASNNYVRLVVKDTSLCPGIGTLQLIVADTTETFLSGGTIPEGFAQANAAVGSWIIDEESTEGMFSLKSQIINEDESSGIEIIGIFSSGSISFDRKVSSEADYDLFKFFIDEVEQFNLSGELDWANVSFPITAGEHTLRWSFEKDSSLSNGQDAAWIDNLILPTEGGTSNNSPVVETTIADQISTEGNSINLNISSNFVDPDGDTLSFSLTNAPSSLSINQQTGVITGTLVSSDVSNSAYTVSVTASDGNLDVTDSFDWTVNAKPQPPAPPPPTNSGGGGSLGILLLGLLGLLRIRRKSDI